MLLQIGKEERSDDNKHVSKRLNDQKRREDDKKLATTSEMRPLGPT